MKYLYLVLVIMFFGISVNAQIIEGCYTEYNIPPTWTKDFEYVTIPEIKKELEPALIGYRTDSILIKEASSYEEIQCVIKNGVVIGNTRCVIKTKDVYETKTYQIIVKPATYHVVQKEERIKIPILRKNEKGGVIRVPCGATPPSNATLPKTKWE